MGDRKMGEINTIVLDIGNVLEEFRWVDYLKDCGYDNARDRLMRIPGVGPKVSDCILLFSMGYYEAFPVDVWVKRIMQYFYVAPDVSLKKIGEFAMAKFGPLAGFAQEYLFYYARDKISEEITVR
jgi:N-glycosylase/DNA lyase